MKNANRNTAESLADASAPRSRRLAYVRNDGGDWVLLLEGEEVIGAWEANEHGLENFTDDVGTSRVNNWPETRPDFTDVSDYGDEITGDELEKYLEWIGWSNA
jgi:hypothetical protein